jgi:hypothetical protein
MTNDNIRARRAVGETLRSIADDIGISTTEVFRRQYGGRTRTRLVDTARSYVVTKVQHGICSTDWLLNPVSLARSAA